MTMGVIGMPLDPDIAKRAKEMAEIADAATRERERADAARVPLPRPRMACPTCYPRRGYVLVDHIIKCCRACGGTATVETPLRAEEGEEWPIHM